MGALTTHVLDTANGRPAAGMRIDLAVRQGDGWRTVKSIVTNAQGRTDVPLLASVEMIRAEFELLFHVQAYFAALGTSTDAPPFLDAVPVRFAVANPDDHYHVPLLVTPWSYSTYRGS